MNSVRVNNKVCTLKTCNFGKAPISIGTLISAKCVCPFALTIHAGNRWTSVMKFHVGHFNYHYNYGKNWKNRGVSTSITLNTAVSFIVSLSTAALSHRKPTLVGLPRNSCPGLGNYKINSIWKYEHLHNMFTALKDAFLRTKISPKHPAS